MCPFRDDDHVKGEKREYALRRENARLRELAIENGLSYGAGKNYIEGETK
jgi:hypothetical protein